MFKKDATGLPVKLTRKEQQNSPSKRKATGKKEMGDDRHQERQQEEWNSSRINDVKKRVLPHPDHQMIRDRPGRKSSAVTQNN